MCISCREQLDAFRCDTPEERRNTLSPVCLPLDELHRLQDKLQHHSRAEEVALRRVRDLEMQLKRVKKNEEVTHYSFFGFGSKVMLTCF
jgi:hypothetical protein